MMKKSNVVESLGKFPISSTAYRFIIVDDSAIDFPWVVNLTGDIPSCIATTITEEDLRGIVLLFIRRKSVLICLGSDSGVPFWSWVDFEKCCQSVQLMNITDLTLLISKG